MLTVLIAGLLLVPMALLMIMSIEQTFTNEAWSDTRQEVTAVAALIRAGQLPSVIVPVVPGVDVVQVVGADRHVIAASPAARRKVALSTIRPDPDEPIQDAQTCGDPEPGCMRLTALRVGAMPDSPVVYAGRRAPSTQSTGFVTIAVALQTGALIALVGWVSWRVSGQTLRPVDTIRRQLAQITFQDLSSRVPQPSGDDEVAKLARTANHTLDRLEHAVRVRRQFVTDASHELRTPLAGLRLQLEEARLHPRDIDLDHLLDHLLGDTARLQQIITDLLYLAGVDAEVAVMREPMDLAALVRSELKPRAARDRLPTELALRDGVVVRAVGHQLSRALANLLDNAQRHAEHTVRVEVCREGDSALLAVSDDGAGIAGPDREKIFERFTRLDAARSRDRGGTGLGLAITSDVVHAHGGTVEVGRSAAGGARFELRLPLAEAS
ncbi:HAMP domain-containing histidine kinase [Streptosporangium sp. NBC_01495]|uniref:sensor histidine kinase n=1 Tax=Streptosporangium sp. NBC_01495 TaxID=2903899 RepID=UPI002E3818F3|nr:HAMP domain-containing sensor histidine kinase [Streptosporangium sp. NBC_01495]